MGELKFFGKKTGRGRGVRGHFDVGIRINNTGTERKAFTVIMRNVPRSIEEAGYIEFAIDENRLYIAPSDSRKGFKITYISKNSTGTVKTTSCKELINWGKNRVGEYNWKFDEEHQLYCIEALSFIEKRE